MVLHMLDAARGLVCVGVGAENGQVLRERTCPSCRNYATGWLVRFAFFVQHDYASFSEKSSL